MDVIRRYLKNEADGVDIVANYFLCKEETVILQNTVSNDGDNDAAAAQALILVCLLLKYSKNASEAERNIINNILGPFAHLSEVFITYCNIVATTLDFVTNNNQRYEIILNMFINQYDYITTRGDVV
jgi:hypothetical protein